MQGTPVARCTVERLMRTAALQGARRSRRVRTTIPFEAAARPEDRVKGDFTATRPTQTCLITLVRVGLDVRGHLGLQRHREHLPGTITHDLVEQRPAAHGALLVGLVLLVDYLEHGRTFPSRRANADPDQTRMGFRFCSGGTPSSRHLAEAHPQVLIIAPVASRV